ncbi:histone H1-delta-like [Halichondria panicea]|uniref:histone H1-delta-like n=1 Tax=Halichondria panicea TaxID=6063 RepID=UPI00312B74EF
MSKTVSSHPKYSEMIASAVTTLKERNGSSRQAISKYVKANYSVGEQADTHVKTSLRKMVSNCDLLQTKGTGASGSFKINKAKLQAEKKAAKKVEKAPKKSEGLKENKKLVAKRSLTKKVTDKKPAAKKSADTKKPATKKKPAAKKAKPPPIPSETVTESSCSDLESSED